MRYLSILKQFLQCTGAPCYLRLFKKHENILYAEGSLTHPVIGQWLTEFKLLTFHFIIHNCIQKFEYGIPSHSKYILENNNQTTHE